MPVVTIESKSARIDDDLTDLSWLMQMNHRPSQKKERYSSSSSSASDYHHENKPTKIDRTSKPLTVVNGQTNRSSKSAFSSDHHYFYDENQVHPVQTMKRKYDSSISYHQVKRFHTEQTLPVYPTTPQQHSSDSFYYDHPPPSSMQQRTSRYMLFPNDPSLSQTIPPVHMPTNSHEKICSDDIEHLLDIFKNEVEMIGFDPLATTSADDCPLNINHCLSTNDFCPY